MPKVVKVGINPKRQTQTQKSYDFTTGVVTITAQQYWLVVFDSKVSDPTLCYGASDGRNTIPDVGKPYPNGANLTCNRVQPMLDPQSAGNLYHVQVDYSTRPQGGGQQDKWDINVSIDGAPVAETLFHDGNGTAIANSAGQNFSQQPTRTYFDGVYRVSFKSKTLNVAAIDALQGSLNLNAFTLSIPSLGFTKLFEAQSVELARCPTSTVLSGDPTRPVYWQAEYEFYYRKPIKSPIDGSLVSGWTIFMLDQGYCELTGGNLVPITDSTTGLPLNSPQYLDGSGHKTTSPHWLQFSPAQPTGDFSPLFTGIA